MLLNNSNNEQLGDAMLFLVRHLTNLGFATGRFKFLKALEVSPKACIALANLLVMQTKTLNLTLSSESRIAINKCLDSIIDQ